MSLHYQIFSKLVHPWGVEPQSMEPESIILSIELRVHSSNAQQKYNFLSFLPNESAKKLQNLFFTPTDKTIKTFNKQKKKKSN